MESFNNIHLIGTSHISKESVREIRSAYSEIHPDMIAVELDRRRLISLKSKAPRPKNLAIIREIGLPGFLFYVLGEYLQKKLGSIVRIDPGSDMMAAVKLGEENNLRIFLIDRDISVTLRRFSKHFQKREIFRMLIDMVTGTGKQKGMDFDIRKVPSKEVIRKVIIQMRDGYPSIHRILIDERDRIMAENLFSISSRNPDTKILAIVGAGHIDGILYYLAQMQQNLNTI